jgi:hypothetical protein
MTLESVTNPEMRNGTNSRTGLLVKPGLYARSAAERTLQASGYFHPDGHENNLEATDMLTDKFSGRTVLAHSKGTIE